MGSKPSLPIVTYEAVVKNISLGGVFYPLTIAFRSTLFDLLVCSEQTNLQESYRKLTQRRDLKGLLGQEVFVGKVRSQPDPIPLSKCLPANKGCVALSCIRAHGIEEII
jgi:hypothetical protein